MTITLQTDRGPKTFEAERTEKGWLLRGKRGAVYGTVRLVGRPELMFLMNFRGRGLGTVDPLGRLWLTEVDGQLRQVRGITRSGGVVTY